MCYDHFQISCCQRRRRKLFFVDLSSSIFLVFTSCLIFLFLFFSRQSSQACVLATIKLLSKFRSSSSSSFFSSRSKNAFMIGFLAVTLESWPPLLADHGLIRISSSELTVMHLVKTPSKLLRQCETE